MSHGADADNFVPSYTVAYLKQCFVA